MKIFLNFLLVLIIALGQGCSGKHLITDKDYREKVEKSYNEKRILASGREEELFSVFEKNLSLEQADALKFLFAFMPLNDLADYTGDFFLANADKALLSRSESPWGNEIPEDIFMHYVLPPRINNENLDSFRIVYYDEIKERIKGLGLKEAALEINHWCHEKVIYKAADIRTSAPMSTILSARGRCGEESTFAVAALRTAGIPARQVYTPRWAHNDDNHAWVEIWDNGSWYYFGACEPEPVLDRGWFTEHARRAMLVHTKSFGAQYGKENTINLFKNYSDVNNLDKYAETKELVVHVSDRDGISVANATVDYKLYNYAEFYTLASVTTDKNGISRFQTGYGDLLVWASAGDEFGYRKISVGETDTLHLVLGNNTFDNYNIELDLKVPPVLPALEGPPQDLTVQNQERIKHEDAIRQRYLDTWMKPEEVITLAKTVRLDSGKVSAIISRSEGNYKEIRKFLIETPDSLRDLAVILLEILPDKDLRDTRSEVLSDHLLNSTTSEKVNNNRSSVYFNEYILNPRVANEILVSWRSFFLKNLPETVTRNANSDPAIIVEYLNDNIIIAGNENYYDTPLTPVGVYNLKVSDELSRSVCFVAICRSLGIPARIEPGRRIPQYFAENNWHDVYFNDQTKPAGNMGFVMLQSSDINPVPEYYIHFTLARFENGKYSTLEYDFNKRVTEFKDELSLPQGNYLLVTGNRLTDGRILSELTFFTLAENEHKTVVVKLRKNTAERKVLGSVDLQKVVDLFDNKQVSLEKLKEKGVIIAWIEPDKEPTKHIFNDLPGVKSELDNWGGYFLFLSAEKTPNNSIAFEPVRGLPANSFFSTDIKLNVFHNYVKLNQLSEQGLPIVLMSDRNGDIIYSSAGYRIGIGEQIVRLLSFM
jgi:transglutaminase-like putative cysteine protease